jgi:alanyl-tRNA synthetase
MTERLYYTDPYIREFDATIARIDPRPEGARGGLVRLDRTAFYPTSGGQPFDTGLLEAARVVDVYVDEEGVVHVVEEDAALREGQRVHGAIDWPRRFDHMQQHSGQHVLSAAFARLFDAPTVSFHLGPDVSTIDLARELTPREIAAAEDEANRIVWDDRAVTIRFASEEEASRLSLRKEPARGGTLRLIDIEGFDLSACGGTHVVRTGAIGVIAIGRWERFKGGQRLEFLCGGRALRRFRALRDGLDAAARLLSTGLEELPAAIERLQGEARDLRRAQVVLQHELARYRAEELAATAEATPAGRLVLQTIDADANGLKSLASAVAAKPGFVVVLVSVAVPRLALVARSPDIVGVHAGDVLKALTARFGGRGGGKPDLAQGGGLEGAAEALLGEARHAVLAKG